MARTNRSDRKARINEATARFQKAQDEMIEMAQTYMASEHAKLQMELSETLHSLWNNRKSIGHVLNQRMLARFASPAAFMGTMHVYLSDLELDVLTASAHRHPRGTDGRFTPASAGTEDLVKQFSEMLKESAAEIFAKINEEAGIVEDDIDEDDLVDDSVWGNKEFADDPWLPWVFPNGGRAIPWARFTKDNPLRPAPDGAMVWGHEDLSAAGEQGLITDDQVWTLLENNDGKVYAVAGLGEFAPVWQHLGYLVSEKTYLVGPNVAAVKPETDIHAHRIAPSSDPWSWQTDVVDKAGAQRHNIQTYSLEQSTFEDMYGPASDITLSQAVQLVNEGTISQDHLWMVVSDASDKDVLHVLPGKMADALSVPLEQRHGYVQTAHAWDSDTYTMWFDWGGFIDVTIEK